MSKESLNECLAYIDKRVNNNPLMSEEELYEVLINSRFFKILGYKSFGRDVKAQYVIAGKRKKADYICRDEYQNVIFVLEAKKPSDRKLGDALSQLWERYVLPLKARYGVLTNGWRLMIYERIIRKPEPTLNLNLGKVTNKGRDLLFRTLRKPEYDITLHSKLEEYFSSVEKLSLKTDLAKENFLETFKLEKSSAFGLLLSSLVNLFDWVYPRSRFLKGAYGFWQKSLAREPKKIPDSWEPLLEKDRDVFRLMFCLETAHALLARLILAKACEDLDFPGISVSNFTLQKIHQVRGQIPLIAYPVVLVRLIREMRDQLVYSIFEEDVFGWWTDGFQGFMEKSSSELLQESADKSLEDFSEAVAKLIFMLYKFDFGEVAGDPLGDLYQQYFDKDTRKALGEFYTPVEVVNYILDAVGYENIGYKRLLDPACGSGTFIVEALKRYLTETKGKAKQHGWAYVLRELCNSPKIVGFDIHPFACLIARTRFMLELIPYFKKALEEEAPRIFYLQRIPVFRTDSLAIETLPPEFQRQRQLTETEEDMAFPVTLPMKMDSESAISVSMILPSWRKILSHALPLYNLDEYFCTLQAMFDTVKNLLEVEAERVPETSLKAHLREYLKDKDFEQLADFFKPYADQILNEIKRIQSDFEDGRLIKSIEDTVLASLLKNYLRYDFVVGNPPYVRQERITEYKDGLQIAYPDVYDGRADLYVYFLKRGIDWLNENGKLGFICSNKFIKRGYGKKIRNSILKTTEITQIVDFGDSGVFKDVINYPCILVLERRLHREVPQLTLHAEISDKPKDMAEKELLEEIRGAIVEDEEIETEFLSVHKVEHPSLKGGWRLAPEQRARVLEKIRKKATCPLGDICEKIFMCAQSNADSVHIVSSQIISKFKLEKDLLKPLVRGEHVKRWRLDWKGLYLLYPHRREGDQVVVIPQREMEEKYPNTWKYLNIEENKEQLTSRDYLMDKIRDGSRQQWYELWIPKQPEWFEQPKIFTPDISHVNNFAFDTEGKLYAPTTVYGILLREDLKKREYYLYLLGLLNSSVLEFYFKHLSPFLRGKYYRYNMQFLEPIPIMLPETLEEAIPRQVIEKVERILQQIEPRRLIERFPETYLGEYRLKGEEFDEIEFTFSADHSGLKPFLSGLAGKGHVVYPDEGEDSIWVDTKEKAQYLILVLRNKEVKQNETVKILIPRDNSIVTEILERVKMAIQEIKATPIDQLEEEINELVYQLYSLNEDDKAIIEGFLKKF